MKQLSVPNIDSKALYNDIAKNKIKRNHVCSKCNADHCDSCVEGNSGLMLFIKTIFLSVINFMRIINMT